MWFTRISLKNPVFATMVMLAIVVLGLFAYQRLKVDQFPNIDFPVVVVMAEYPGASPEIVESEVTKKIEEGVNSIAGINALTSRSNESQSIVIIEFQLHIDGRKAAEDVREKVAAVRPTFRTEVKEPRVLRFDPSSRAIWSLAVLPDATKGTAMTSVELTNWSDQVLKKRLENVRGVGSVTLVGGAKREINVYLNPVAMEAFGITADQVVAAVRNENQELPLGAIRSLAQDRVVQIDARVQRPEDFGKIIVARKNGAPVRVDQVARVADGAQELDSLALYNGQRTLLLTVQKSQDENTIEVVDGLKKTVADMASQLPPGVRLEQITDNSRPIRVSVDNVRRTLIEGALLTVLIVFLFLNSWRSTVITGLTLPISLIGTFLFMNMFGFTINMVTLMALSLCVGLLIDDAIVVRENIVRHVQMGKGPYQAAMDGTQEIGLAVLATTFSIVAVFLPIGFMGGIIGKFFHEFGVTIVAAVLISMFVSFTLDPMLSSVWHDPQIESHGKKANPSLYDRTIGRVTGWFDHATDALSDAYQGILRWALVHKLATLLLAIGVFVTSVVMVPLLGTEFVPKADFSELSLNFYTPVGSSLEATEAKARQVEAIVREFPESAVHADHHQHRQRAGQDLRVRLRAADRPKGPHAQRGHDVGRAARADEAGAGHDGDARGPARRRGRQQAGGVLAAGRGPEGAGAAVAPGHGEDPGHSRPGGPRFQRQGRQAGHRHRGQARRRLRPGPVDRADRRFDAHAGGRPDGGQLARPGRPDLRRQRAPRRPTRATRRRTWSDCPSRWAATPTAAPASCG